MSKGVWATKKADSLQQIQERPGKCRFGVWGALEVVFIISFIKGKASKLHRIIMLHFGLVSFRIRVVMKIRKSFMFMVLGPSGHDHDSQNQLY